MKRIFLIILILLSLTGCNNNEKEESKKIVETNGMLSYTIDGEKTDIKPSKEDGYIVNKIICDNGSDIMWDNDNWEVELTKINSKDRCKVDFTKDTSKEGYRITITTNSTSSLDSLSKVTTLNGTVKIYSKSKIKKVNGCSGVIEGNKVIISNVIQNQTCDITVEQTLADTIKTVYPSSGERDDFNTAYTKTALHTVIDYDGNTTYYFTGNPNNWVRFAGSLWRIIRINGNESVRLLYAGTGGEDGYVGSEQYYATRDGQYNHPAYVGWKYDKNGTNGRGNTESYVYSTISSWYTINITNVGLTSYIDTDTIYCNDRSIGSGTYSASSKFYYGAYTRLAINKTPTLQCIDNADRFTTFGLMTADEVAFAGGVYDIQNKNAYYYLNRYGGSSTGDKTWWTMSPYYFNWRSSSSKGYADVFFVRGSGIPGGLHGDDVNYNCVVRPVISLKKEVLVIGGDGSAENPYEVTI